MAQRMHVCHALMYIHAREQQTSPIKVAVARLYISMAQRVHICICKCMYTYIHTHAREQQTSPIKVAVARLYISMAQRVHICICKCIYT
jgi:hypothetical protein